MKYIGLGVILKHYKKNNLGLLWWSSVKNPPCNAGEMSLIPVSERSHMLWIN